MNKEQFTKVLKDLERRKILAEQHEKEAYTTELKSYIKGKQFAYKTAIELLTIYK